MMAQMNRELAQSILDGSGITSGEVEQLCHFYLRHTMTDDRKRKTGGEVELLPCPWCGEAQSEIRVSEGSTFRWRKVDGCCTDGPEVRHDTMADDQAAAEADSHRRAIEAWNTRANVDRALAECRAEVEALRASMAGDAANHVAIERDHHKTRAERLAGLLRRWSDADVDDIAMLEADTASALEQEPRP